MPSDASCSPLPPTARTPLLKLRYRAAQNSHIKRLFYACVCVPRYTRPKRGAWAGAGAASKSGRRQQLNSLSDSYACVATNRNVRVEFYS